MSLLRKSAVAGIASLLAIGAISATAQAATPRTNLPDIEDEVMCTICGTLLEESDSPQANSERALIRKLIDQGESKDQIKDALVAQYGPRVLATPSGHGFDLAAWIVPGLIIAIALVALGIGASRVKRGSAAPAPAPLDPADAERLDADLRSQDL